MGRMKRLRERKGRKKNGEIEGTNGKKEDREIKGEEWWEEWSKREGKAQRGRSRKGERKRQIIEERKKKL